MKKILLSLIFILSALVSTQAQQKVILHMNDGSRLVRSVEDVDSITFGDIQISVSKPEVIEKTNVTASLSVAIDHWDGVSEVGVLYATDKNKLNESSAKAKKADNVPANGVATVDIDGLTMETTYYVLAYCVAYGDRFNAVDTLEFTTNGKYPVPEMVDLGLSVKWASWNVGAQRAADYGSYLGWGDPTGKNNSYNNSDYPTLASGNSIAGNAEYDIATAMWGDDWKIPTKEQWEELVNGCTIKWATKNDITGWEITSKTNGNSIFLPNAGYYTPMEDKIVLDKNKSSETFYWTCEQFDQSNAVEVNVRIGKVYPANCEKMIHLPIRAVYGKDAAETNPDGMDTEGEKVPLNESVAGNAVDLGLSCLWANFNVGATDSTECGDYYAWAEIEGKSNYTSGNYTHYGDSFDDIKRSANDVARMKWGGKWRMPTVQEIQDLFDNCEWQWTGLGYKVKSKINGNSIFLPANGYMNGNTLSNSGSSGCYWSSENDNRESAENKKAYSLRFSNGEQPHYAPMPKEIGYAIRPVMNK